MIPLSMSTHRRCLREIFPQRVDGIGFWQNYTSDEPGSGIRQVECSPMQRGDRGHDRQTKAVTRQTSAPVDPVEALDHPGVLGQWDAWAVVLNDQGDGVSFFGCPNTYRRTAASIFQGIIEQIYDRAREEILFAECQRLALDFGLQRDACGFRGSIVQLNDIGDDGGKRYRRKGLAARSGFGFGDL